MSSLSLLVKKECNKKSNQADFDEIILAVLRDMEKISQNCFQLNGDEFIW